MQRTLWTGLIGLSCLALLAVNPSASAMRIMMRPPTVQQKVVQADVVVVGKVTAFETKTIKAERYPGDKMKAEYRIAVIKISNAILGVKGLTHLKVGLLPAFPVRPLGPVGPGGGPGRPFIRRGPPQAQDITLRKGQKVCLFLKQHPTGNFYVAISPYGAMDAKTPTFAKDVAEARKLAKVFANPMVALKVKSAGQRFESAALLLQRYRSYRGINKTEPIAAAESKLILETIANGDWKARPVFRPGLGNQPMTPISAFSMLGLQPKDGWTQPRDFRQFPEAAKAWLKANASTYRIQRFVSSVASK